MNDFLIHGAEEVRKFEATKIETRNFAEFELRKGEGEKPGLRGYAAVFNSDSEDFGGWREQIAPGAFKRDLDSKADVRALINHDTGRVIGRTKSGTLRLSEDERGLMIDLDLPDTQEARDLMTNIEAGNIDGMSFGFRVRSDHWEERDGYHMRTLKDVELLEVSAVAFPAYPATEIGKRSLDTFLQEQNNTPSSNHKIAAKRRLLDLDQLTTE